MTRVRAWADDRVITIHYDPTGLAWAQLTEHHVESWNVYETGAVPTIVPGCAWASVNLESPVGASDHVPAESRPNHVGVVADALFIPGSDGGALLCPGRRCGVEFPVALLDAASRLVPGDRTKAPNIPPLPSDPQHGRNAPPQSGAA